ncbi:unnamed protein product [Euphydryas editha]|uniref:Reverse transcriptase domain-containing protein n=1 Tax=Euphydryas editha TaxID=104508 RepID=A0AAU9V8G5_EUPED|nr:unnamed protein product [Euphydryas editha]
MLPKKIKIGLINPRSLGTGHEELVVALQEHEMDILAVNETWLKEREEAIAPTIPGYRLRHVPRSSDIRSRGGGVGFYIKCELSARTLPHPINAGVEQMWIELHINNKNIAIGTAYRPPWLSVQTFLNALSESICSLSYHDHITILGDFNINVLNSSEGNTLLLNDLLSNFGLRQYVTEPTHFTSQSDTLLDLVCTDANVTQVWVDHRPCLSDHAFVVCELDIPKLKPRPKTVYFRPLKDIEPALLNTQMTMVDWNAMSEIGDVNELTKCLTFNLIRIFDRLAPLKLITIKDKSYPWVTYNIRLLMKRRDEAFYKARICNTPPKIAYYKELKQLVAQAIKAEKDAYFKKYVTTNVKNPKSMWNHIKEIVSFKNSNVSLPSNLCDPEKLNSHFLNVPGDNIVPSSVIDYYNNNEYSTKRLKLKAVSERDVVSAVRELHSNAIGLDGISLDMLLMSFSYTVSIITTLVNKSITSSVFPDMWRGALVRPIPKIAQPLSFKDLRPISILPCISKIMEKIICRQLTEYIEGCNILPVLQSGFRKHHSTTTALINVMDDVLLAQDDGNVTIMVLLDFSRAFDAINIELLLAKLRFYGLEEASVRWFASYLQNRTQIVEIKNGLEGVISSRCSPIKRGVPQGSILGPILFSIYSADVTKCVQNCKFHIYADDIQIYLSFKPHDINQSLSKINDDLDRIFSWSQSNALVLNATKTKYIVLGTRKQVQLVRMRDPAIFINGTRLECVSEVRNLGLILDEHMRFEKHVSETIRGCFYRLKVLYRIRNSIDEKTRIRLCETLVLSKFNYVDSVIGPRLLERTKKSIQRVQNACARYCFNIPRRDHVTPYINQASMLKMENRRRLHLATMLFGIVKYRMPAYLFDRLNWARDVNTSHSTRSQSYALSIPIHRTAAFRGSFKYAATKCWNNLPPPLRSIGTQMNFKRLYRHYLLMEQKQLL